MSIPDPKPHVYLRSEITSTVTALALCATNMSAAGAANPDYTAGYIDALRAVLVAFGVEMPSQFQRGQP